MAEGHISFHREDIDFEFTAENAVKLWISNCARNEGFGIENIDYIFCSDDYLLQMNMQYLQHDTYTDILTFDYSEGEIINADIYISIERVRENASEFGVAFENELLRVIIHGVLHLVGYIDKSPKDRDFMRLKENHYLALYVN